jgi:type IV pilus assembly protein PilN
MYSLDVNFLKDRPEYSGQRESVKSAPAPVGSMTPLYIGVAVGLLPLLCVGGFWFFLNQQNAQLQQDIEQLNNKLGSLKQAEQQIKQLTDETNKVRSETNALAGVFTQMKPWSAMLQDIRERTPPNVTIESIEQKQVALTPAANAAPPPAPANNAKPGSPAANQAPPTKTQLVIEGAARTFDDVNYFLLTLQRSPFLNQEDTQLVAAKLEDNPSKLQENRPQAPNQSGATITYQLPKFVGYKIQTTLNGESSQKLIRDLDRKGAVGVVSRIRTLQEKGVFQK